MATLSTNILIIMICIFSRPPSLLLLSCCNLQLAIACRLLIAILCTSSESDNPTKQQQIVLELWIAERTLNGGSPELPLSSGLSCLESTRVFEQFDFHTSSSSSVRRCLDKRSAVEPSDGEKRASSDRRVALVVRSHES